ncbi:hypothetical protein W03_19400 [Nitrosomonas sp. PY1]|uniref:right-handed parallel beta-helix repeat-containing protein n=1 Tax=Nitrosomonas sp. PY1 TaxID=1803906 RepID=UPI001FC7D899|nr:right-handed parallel beta-helix repeat-containing protein [Nitrosomonas sp. PY1]GKS69936.1 hypothetical protein W03_19400 [Nitrosomonas sp. PY1]
MTIDSTTIQNAINSAGVGGIINLTPGKTYLVDRKIQLLPKQKIFGYGAIVKRINQIITTSSATITNGATSIVVANVTGFEVGQQIGLYVDSTHYTTSNSKIASIDTATKTISVMGASFTLAGGLNCVSPKVFLSFDTIFTADGCEIFGLTLNGNRSNWSYYRWEIASEIHAAHSNNTIRDVTIDAAPGEAIQETGSGNYASIGNVFDANTITNCNGNGIHLSGSQGTRITNNYIYNTNIQGSVVGHSGGSITVSNGARDYLIQGNRLELGRAGVGEIDSVDNSRFRIVDNDIINMSTYMIEARGPNRSITDITVADNRFYNDTPLAASDLIAVDVSDTGSGTATRINISNNQFYNAGINLSRVSDVVVTGNVMAMVYQASDTYHNPIKISTATDTIVNGNTIKYGYASISLNGNLTNVSILGNVLSKPYYYGIFGVGSANSNLSFTANNISMDNNVSNSAQGMTLGANAVARNNNIMMTKGHSGIRVNGVANAIVQNNTVRSYAANKTIRIETGSTGYIVSENQVNYAVSDIPAVGIRVSNNDIVT